MNETREALREFLAHAIAGHMTPGEFPDTYCFGFAFALTEALDTADWRIQPPAVANCLDENPLELFCTRKSGHLPPHRAKDGEYVVEWLD